jgi:2,3-bisphosphoglycerate-dependent phosphoglycerate mutase
MSRLVLLRHGESTANAEDRFAGWLDVPLTPRGLAQAEAVGRSLATLRPHAVHTSVLGRAISTACLMATAADWDVPACHDWRLNERHYGALQGLDKAEARRLYGTKDVEAWRRSVDVAPPPAAAEQLAEQFADRRYAQDPRALLTVTESLGDVARRMAPYWHEVLQRADERPHRRCRLAWQRGAGPAAPCNGRTAGGSGSAPGADRDADHAACPSSHELASSAASSAVI